MKLAGRDNSRYRCGKTLCSSAIEWLYSAVKVSESQFVKSCATDQDGCRRHTLALSAGFEAVSACNSMPPPVRHVLLRLKAVPVATSISPRPPTSAWPDDSSLRS